MGEVGEAGKLPSGKGHVRVRKIEVVEGLRGLNWGRPRPAIPGLILQ